MKIQLPLAEHFALLPDPRRSNHNTKKHELLDIIIIAILATICGADSWVEIERFGHSKEVWLRQFLTLENGIPSHDTFGRVFSILDPAAFEACFNAWVTHVRAKRGVVALDGKSVRCSHESGARPLHLVNAFCTEAGICVGQRKVDGKTNEITAIPELLDLLALDGCIVTTDAMGCQSWIAQKVIYCNADYVLAVKGNQGSLHTQIRALFAQTTHTKHSAQTHDRAHGRKEVRTGSVLPVPDSIANTQKWAGVRSVVSVTAERTVKGKVSKETRYYISSLACDATELLRVVRAHWRVENSLHWSLDIAFREDESRIRIGHAAENIALVRKLALNLLRKEMSVKVGIKAKRMNAAWDNEYLLKVLGVESWEG